MAEQFDQMSLLEVISRLREGCGWNAGRSPLDLVAAAEQELAELRHAVEGGNVADIADEVGDVLFNVYSIVGCYAAAGAFESDDIERRTVEKMIRRHPYVFAGAADPGPDEGARQWEAIKADERNDRDRRCSGVASSITLPGCTASDADFDELKRVLGKIVGEADVSELSDGERLVVTLLGLDGTGVASLDRRQRVLQIQLTSRRPLPARALAELAASLPARRCVAFELDLEENT